MLCIVLDPNGLLLTHLMRLQELPANSVLLVYLSATGVFPAGPSEYEGKISFMKKRIIRHATVFGSIATVTKGCFLLHASWKWNLGQQWKSLSCCSLSISSGSFSGISCRTIWFWRSSHKYKSRCGEWRDSAEEESGPERDALVRKSNSISIIYWLVLGREIIC